MKKLLLISLSGWLAVTTLASTNSAPLTALELLDKFAAAQEPLKSFIAIEEVTGRLEGVSRSADGDFCSTNEIRLDGSRVAERSWGWGLGVGSRARPQYTSRLTDGQKVLYFDQEPAPGKLVIMPESTGWFFRTGPKRMAENIGRLLLSEGFGVIDPGDRRIDLRLRSAKDLRLRQKLELAGWVPSPCYVLEGETEVGHYTLWIDPARGYQLAKAVVLRRPEHLGPNGQPRGSTLLSTVEKVRHEMRDGLWVPVEIAKRMQSTGPRGQPSLQTLHVRVTRFVLNPDHEALRSFVPDDIRDGTKVTLVGDNRRTQAMGTWRDGRAVDKDGKVLWTPELLAGVETNK